MTFSELVKKNKREIMENPELLDKIEAKIEKRADKKIQEVYRPQKSFS